MDLELGLKVATLALGAVLGTYTIRKFRMDKKNNKSTEQTTIKSVLSGSYKNRTIFIHNSGSKASLLNVTVNGIDAFNSNDVECSDDTIGKNQNIAIEIKTATNALQPPYTVVIDYRDKYITKNAKKTGKNTETFRQSFN
ncbi:hypothetical protein CN996_09725 [Bacillus cereus]|nr:hypothetical protein CN996_09725 [Bacillus cereus]